MSLGLSVVPEEELALMRLPQANFSSIFCSWVK